jgi:hypothetical protein
MPAITLVSSGGIPVSDAPLGYGAPVDVVASGGIPAVLVSSGGLPIARGSSWLPEGATLFADIPNGHYFAAGAVQPDFTTWLSAASATFTGPSGRYLTNSSNLLATVAANVPRISYLGGVPYFLYEPAATNVMTQSNTFSSWIVQRATLTQGMSAPDGSAAAWRFAEDTTNSTHLMQRQLSSSAGPVAVSIWVRKYTRNFICMNDNAGHDLYLDLVNGTYNDVFSFYTTSAPVLFGDGSRRYSYSFNAATGQFINIFLASASGVKSYQGDGAGAADIFGVQVEAGLVASSYIPTTASTVTRAAESVSGLSAPGSLTVTFDNGSTQVISAANFANPTNINRRLIKIIAA